MNCCVVDGVDGNDDLRSASVGGGHTIMASLEERSSVGQSSLGIPFRGQIRGNSFLGRATTRGQPPTNFRPHHRSCHPCEINAKTISRSSLIACFSPHHRYWTALPNFREYYRVTLYSRVFHGLTSCQLTPREWGVTAWYQSLGTQVPRA